MRALVVVVALVASARAGQLSLSAMVPGGPRIRVTLHNSGDKPLKLCVKPELFEVASGGRAWPLSDGRSPNEDIQPDVETVEANAEVSRILELRERALTDGEVVYRPRLCPGGWTGELRDSFEVERTSLVLTLHPRPGAVEVRLSRVAREDGIGAPCRDVVVYIDELSQTLDGFPCRERMVYVGKKPLSRVLELPPGRHLLRAFYGGLSYPLHSYAITVGK